jgi:hypothetical protein
MIKGPGCAGSPALLGLCQGLLCTFSLGAWRPLAINESITRVLITVPSSLGPEATTPSPISRVK